MASVSVALARAIERSTVEHATPPAHTAELAEIVPAVVSSLCQESHAPIVKPQDDLAGTNAVDAQAQVTYRVGVLSAGSAKALELIKVLARSVMEMVTIRSVVASATDPGGTVSSQKDTKTHL